jgi:hypothetical protein
MKDICIVFERDKGFIARAIRWFTKGEVNHVAVKYDSEDWQEEWIVEAMPRGVFARKSKNRKWYAAFKFYSKDGTETDDLRRISKHIGEKYDFATFFMFMWVQLCWRWLKLKVKKPWRSAKGQICSELIARLLEKDIQFENPQWVHPQELLEICRSRKDLFEEIPCE